MPGFLSSNLYYKYLSDLINSVRVDEFIGGNANTPNQGWTQESDRNSSVTEGSQAQVIHWFDGGTKGHIALFYYYYFFEIIQGFFKNMVASMSNFVLISQNVFQVAARY